MSMFEVELKFILTKKEELCLLEGAMFIEEQNFIDIYYDKKDYSLSTNDIWLRTRNGKFVLKLPIPTANESLKKQRNSPKQEIEDLDKILHYLNIVPEKNIHEDLCNNGILPLYEFKNIRKKYSKGEFIIDIDKAIFKDFIYETCEIEMVVKSESEINNAITKIESFAAHHGIQIGHVEGRLIEYLRRKNPIHYQKLQAVKQH